MILKRLEGDLKSSVLPRGCKQRARHAVLRIRSVISMKNNAKMDAEDLKMGIKYPLYERINCCYMLTADFSACIRV